MSTSLNVVVLSPAESMALSHWLGKFLIITITQTLTCIHAMAPHFDWGVAPRLGCQVSVLELIVYSVRLSALCKSTPTPVLGQTCSASSQRVAFHALKDIEDEFDRKEETGN